MINDPENAETAPGAVARAVDPAAGTGRVPLTPAAERALAEAAERRRTQKERPANVSAEIGGPKGPDPVRYGDWEKGGIASDF